MAVAKPQTIDALLAEARASLPGRCRPADLMAALERGALVVDTRPVDQRRRDGELAGAIVIDRNVLEWRLDPASPDRIPEVADHDREIVVVCNEGYSSSLVAATLQRLGLRRATDLEGGYQALLADGSVPHFNSDQRSDHARLILLCGLPGAGKTTLARRLAAALGAVRLCADEWMADLAIDLFDEDARERLELRFWALAQALLRVDRPVILESGFWQRADRDAKRLGGRALGAAVELRYLDAPIDELVRRVERRNAESPRPAATITRSHLEQWWALFDPPGPDELALFDPPLEGDWDPQSSGSNTS